MQILGATQPCTVLRVQMPTSGVSKPIHSDAVPGKTFCSNNFEIRQGANLTASGESCRLPLLTCGLAMVCTDNLSHRCEKPVKSYYGSSSSSNNSLSTGSSSKTSSPTRRGGKQSEGRNTGSSCRKSPGCTVVATGASPGFQERGPESNQRAIKGGAQPGHYKTTNSSEAAQRRMHR